MSEALFSGLPRFDAGGAPASTQAAGRWKQPFLTGRDAEPKPPVEPEPMPVIAAPPEVSPQALDLARVEASLASLSGQIDRLEREAKALALQSVETLAARLFPELSRAFLAEEISRHLATMIPASAAMIEIRAEAGLADQLQARIETLPGLAQRCVVTPVPAAGQGRVDVSWQSGGLTFDFDGLLAACLSHLTPIQPVTKEHAHGHA